jgi:succinate dehydrogenase / fumarate reductase cytochrome b subunit
MIFSGLLVFFFLWLHLVDFTLGDKVGPDTIVKGAADGDSLGLFGLVWNSFLFSAYWWRPVIYLCVVCLLGLHLSHGIASIFQTMGLRHEGSMPWIERVSLLIGVVIALGYSSIPLYVNIMQTPRI